MRKNSTRAKKPTMTVAIPAYNEEDGISSLLRALVVQHQKGFLLEKIIVYSDRSTDGTHAIVRSLSKKYPIISLTVGRTRLGKYYRLNDVFRQNRSDILVVLDADILPVGRLFLSACARSITSDMKAMMVAVHQVQQRPSSFIGKILHTDFVMWDFVRWSIPHFASPNNFYGSATVFRGSFAKTIRIPTRLSDPHLYLYLIAEKVNGFRYTLDAVIYQWPIATLADYKKFMRRSLGKPDKKLEKLFHIDTKNVYKVPLKAKIRGFFIALRTYPLFVPLAVIVNIYFHKLAHFEGDQNAIWSIVRSTKLHS